MKTTARHIRSTGIIPACDALLARIYSDKPPTKHTEKRDRAAVAKLKTALGKLRAMAP